MEHLRTVRAQALYEAMLKARRALDEIHEKYQRTLAGAMNADASPEELQAMRREGRAYAQALTAYSNAAMTWLTYVDSGLHSKEANHAK